MKPSVEEFTSLLYGVGVHHAAKSPKHREIVEMLFRKRVLQVVFATGSLALGVNMPCKTAVFLGDSIFLTPLMYRQMSGRAGRRGQDVNGEVLFVGVPEAKRHRLVGSAVTEILASLPFSPSFTVQQLLMLRAKPEYIAVMKRGLKTPLFETGVAKIGSASEQFVRFTLDFLVDFGVVNADGVPVDFAGLISHTFYTQPANFAFVYLLQKGYFHRLVRNYSNRRDLNEALIASLAQIFGRYRINSFNRPKMTKRLVLPRMPEAMRGLLQEYNTFVVTVYSNFAKTFSQGSKAGHPDTDILPLSKQAFLSRATTPNSPVVCSPFVGLSGQADDFTLNYVNGTPTAATSSQDYCE